MNFTYRIKWSKFDISYYGVRYANDATIDSLMVTYFTSSKYVHDFISRNGLPDIIEIRKIFTTKLQSKQWEERVISKGLTKSPKWLNKGNNGSFKNIVMDSEMINKISIARNLNKKEPKKAYNDGTVTKYFGLSEEIPIGWALGRFKTEKILKQNLAMKSLVNNYSDERRIVVGAKISAANKGKKKPEGFGAKISAANKGRKHPKNSGENNSTKRPEVRAKLSISRKGKGLIRWFYNKETHEKFWVYKDQVDMVDLSIFTPGQIISGKWYNNGVENFWIKNETEIIPQDLVLGKIKIKFNIVTDGVTNLKLRVGVEIPPGFKPGRTLSIKPGQIKYCNDGNKNITIKIDEEIPLGFYPGKKKKKRNV